MTFPIRTFRPERASWMAMAVTTSPTRTQRRRRAQLAPSYRGDIEGLRALAVVLVVAFHAGLPLLSGGYVGVDVFFVLSGFLITGLLVDELRRTGTISLVGFYARRVRRLLPLAALVLVATVAGTMVLVPPLDRSGVGADVSSAALGVANWHFALESSQYMADSAKSPVLHYWSLGVEEQFYLVWPLLLLLVAGKAMLAVRRWDIALRRVAVALVALGGASFLVSWWAGGDGSFAYYGLHTRAWELAVGAALALARPLLPRLPRLPAVLLGQVGLVLVLVSAVVLDESTPFPGTAAAMPVLGTAALVASGARMYTAAVPRLLQLRAVRFVGRVSYSWYLWHWPCLVLAASRWGIPGEQSDGAAAAPRLGLALTLVVVGISFALATASHLLVEQPARTLGWLSTSRRATFRVGTVLVAASLLSGAILWVPNERAPGVVATGYGMAPQREGPADPEPMSMAEARADVPPAHNGCYTGYSATKPPPVSSCRYGPAHGSRTIALVGDSHAAQWLPAFVQAAQRNGWTLYYLAKSQCAVADVPVDSPKEKGRYTSCDSWRHQALRELDGIDGLDAVYIGRWASYLSDTLGPDGRRLARDQVPAAWRAGMVRTMTALSTVPHVVVLRDTPRPRIDVPACLSTHLSRPDRCSFPRAGHTGLDARLVAAEHAAGGSRLSTLDLSPLVCPGTACQVVDRAGVVVYRDSHHLTATFSENLGPKVAARLLAVAR
jgi:peptidoglycan/LPS O-acetylase OafA/YrhL